MNFSLNTNTMNSILKTIEASNNDVQKRYPGEAAARQPVHTVYGGAHLFSHTTSQKLGELALKSFETYASTPEILAMALGFSDLTFAKKVHSRVREKLKREAIEDFRIDFEDGFGYRPDEEEDRTAVTAATELAQGMKKETLPPFIGIRIKTLSEELKARGLRTLDLFITTLCDLTANQLPSGFVVTLPKIMHVGQVTALVRTLEEIEKARGLPSGTLKMEMMIETPQSLFDTQGRAVMPSLVEAARGRCVAAHFGTYDYTASLSVTASHQEMDHPACEFALQMMKVSLSGTGVWLSDGATNVMPVEIYKSPKNDIERKENMESIHRAWRLSHKHVQHSLRFAVYQGWDLHPAQLPVRYATVYAFFLEGLASATARLKNFIDHATKATLIGEIFDDAATGQGLLNYFLRALNCGAITEEEILMTGLTLDEVRLRSFKKIMENRTRRK